MKQKEDETYEQWIERARLYEYGLALQRIAEGEDADKVMDSMSKRLMQKMMHPIIKEITKPVDKDLSESKKRYEEIMNRKGLNSDHVSDNT